MEPSHALPANDESTGSERRTPAPSRALPSWPAAASFLPASKRLIALRGQETNISPKPQRDHGRAFLPQKRQIPKSTIFPLRILVVDDHAMTLAGLRGLIERQPGWEVCGVATTGREAIEQALALEPDIVVMDMGMPELNGLEATVQIKRRLPQTEILIFSAHETEDLIRETFATGAKSFVFKSQAQQFLVEAIQSLSEHKPFFINQVSEVLFSNMLNRSEAAPHAAQTRKALTARERQIVPLLAEGGTNKEVALALGISLRTAESHRANILRKLSLDSIASLVRYAIRNKIIEA